MEYTFHFEVVLRQLPYFLKGLLVTAQLAGFAMFFGVIIGAFGALARRSHNFIAYGISTAYVEIMRNTPLLVQIYFIYFGLPEIGIPIGSYPAVLLALTLNNGAYCAEIERAGLEAIHKSELDAALSLGLSYPQALKHIIFPHVLKIIYPPMCSQLIMVILVTSLASVLGIQDLTGLAREFDALTFRSLETYLLTMCLYVAVTLIATAALVYIGKKFYRIEIKVF